MKPYSKFLEELRTKYHTGSQVFGVATKDSDIDVVIDVDDKDFVLHWADYVCKTSGENYDEDGFVTYRVPGTQYNIIQCINEDVFSRWTQATEIMKRCCLRSNAFKEFIRIKENRIFMFDVFYKYDGEW